MRQYNSFRLALVTYRGNNRSNVAERMMSGAQCEFSYPADDEGAEEGACTDAATLAAELSSLSALVKSTTNSPTGLFLVINTKTGDIVHSLKF